MLTRLLASDPGWNRLRMALQTVLTIGAAMAAEWTFVQVTHAMWLAAPAGVLPPAQAALLAAQHHGMTIIGLMIGAVAGMVAAFAGGMFPSIRQQVAGSSAMVPLMVAGMAVGLPLSSHRAVALTVLVFILAGGAYCRRYGPLGFFGGQMVFMGDFFGFFLGAEVSIRDIGWLSAEVALGVLVAMLAQFTVFYPGRRAALRRLQRSYEARRRDLVDFVIRMLDQPAEASRMTKTLRRKLVGLNEAGLMSDGHLNHPGAIPQGWSAETLHEVLFDVELAVTNLARFATHIVTRSDFDGEVHGEVHGQVRAALVAVRDGDIAAAESAAEWLTSRVAMAPPVGTSAGGPRRHADDIVLYRFGLAVLGHCDAQRRFQEARRVAAAGAPTSHGVRSTGLGSPVVLMGGWLPGSAMVSAEASNTPDGRELEEPRWRRVLLGHVPLAPNIRVAVQMFVAVGGAVLVGEILSGRRFYWAVIAAFVTFMGANNASEQLRKGVDRVLGTFVGVIIGGLLAHLVGPHGWVAIGVILAAIFLGVYLMRVSYAFMVIGITVMVSQLYVQLDEFSNSLLRLRLEETALGAGIAAVTVLCVLPLRTGRVARVSASAFLSAIDAVVTAAAGVLLGTVTEDELRGSVRRMDGAYQALVAVTRSLRTPLFARDGDERDQFQAAASAARHHARDLLIDVPAAGVIQSGLGIEEARERFSHSLSTLLAWLETGAHDRPYVRSTWLLDRTREHMGSTAPLTLAARDLVRLDGALATMAGIVGLHIEELDAPRT